jgi:hypothetical protein
MSKNLNMEWISNLSQYDNIYLITGFHEIDKFLLDYNIDCKLNLIVILETTKIEPFLRNILKNCHIKSMRGIPLGVAYWSDKSVNKYTYILRTLFRLIEFRVFLSRSIKEKCKANLFIYSYINNIQYFIFKKYFDKVSTGKSVVFKIPSNSDFRVKKKVGLLKYIFKIVYKLFSGAKLSLYESSFYVAYGFSDTKDTKDTKDAWIKIRTKYGIPTLNVKKNSILIIDAPIQFLVGVDTNKSLLLLEQYFTKLLSDHDVYIKPHYGQSAATFDNSSIFRELKIIQKGYPVELYMDLFKKVYFFSSTAIASCNDECIPISLLDILVYDDNNAYQENINLLKISAGLNIDKITFAEI